MKAKEANAALLREIGDKSPTTSELERALGVPKTVLRTWLNRMRREGLVRPVSNYDGTRDNRWRAVSNDPA